MSVTVNLRAVQDAFVSEADPDRNYGDRPKLSVKGDAPEKRTLIAFALKSLPSDANIHSATLHLHLRGDWSGTSELTVQRIDERWNEGRVDWNNQPGVAGVTATETVTSGSAGDAVTVDVTTAVAAAVERGKTWHGLRVIVDSSGTRNFHSSEVADQSLRPTLVIEYSGPPPEPVRLRPRGGDAVNASQPRLGWSAVSQSASQVQVHTSDDFTTPDYDSGWVVNDETGWDLATATSPTFSALADGDSRYWRVRIKDEDSNISPWSNAVRFERHPYGTFDITAPAADGDAVEESSPTIVTSFSGTQRRLGWRLRVKDIDDDPDAPFETVISTAFVGGYVSTDASFELPRRSVTRRDFRYQVQARLWDEFDRGTAVGERNYVQASREFIYDPSAGVTVVSDLDAIQPTEGSPLVHLSWTRSSAPDSYDIYVDDEAVAQQIDPADVLESGTTYGYDLWLTKPGEEHTFEVVATENHQDSIANPTVTLTVVIKGLWLVCPDKDLAVLITGHEKPTSALGEIGTTYELLNRRSPVRIIDGIRGMEGSVSGRIRSTAHGTAAEMRRRLMRLKTVSPDTEIRLILPYQNIPVFLGNLTLPPAPPLVSEEYDVSVEFWQAGEFEGKGPVS